MQNPTNLLGLHVLLTLKTEHNSKLTTCDSFITFVNLLLQEHDLELIGQTSHVFENNSFTIAFCLKESHICIHTWPEINQLTTDVYLCNYSCDNTQKVRDISNQITNYFEATIVKRNEMER